MKQKLIVCCVVLLSLALWGWVLVWKNKGPAVVATKVEIESGVGTDPVALLKIEVRNFMSEVVIVDLVSDYFGGDVYFSYSDGTVDVARTKAYAIALATGPRSVMQVRIDPGKAYEWKVAVSDLVGRDGSPYEIKNAGRLKIFADVDAVWTDVDGVSHSPLIDLGKQSPSALAVVHTPLHRMANEAATVIRLLATNGSTVKLEITMVKPGNTAITPGGA